MVDLSQAEWIVGSLVILMNVTAFSIMAFDKRRSRKAGAERISEGMLFFLATCFGSVGVWLGILVFRHKTRKWYFALGIPLLIFENTAAIWLIFHWLAA